MANEQNNRGGAHEQQVKAGEQSHKNTSGSSKGEGRERAKGENETGSGSTRGGSHEQHVKNGEQSHKGGSGSSNQGGSHVKAGEQSHKNR
ncbi:hypothetical protein SAMN05444581_104218 [Methylocapsa palsarum]|uniref:Uncharacterized protein n=1 Tax=Methylocapsa palsarum TaxID=1612308 RepID=A0A1I3Y1Z1_9HYPH|nr:hypothetical protein [Methylocapsa palsarum]SFK25311.1 hypothetical protein SAMN05444581_104218 [Methylocapsa palsarum]